jgi:cell division protein FtsI (penicillin-binding protein 3)
MKKGRIYKYTLILYRCFVIFAIYCIISAIFILSDKDLKGEEEKARQTVGREEDLRRGDIISCDGQPLATYFPEFTVYADFAVGIDKGRTVNKRNVSAGGKGFDPVTLDTFRIHVYEDFAESVSRTLGGTAYDYYKDLYNSRIEAENKKGGTKIVLKQIDIFQRDSIFSSPYLRKYGKNKTGIYSSETGRRRYPFGDSFAHSVIGLIKDNSGVSGIESICNEDLENGDNIITTIDTRIQDICEMELRKKISEDKRFVGGTIVVMDVLTGDIKAVANSGMYNKRDYNDIRDIFNNAARATIEPGSTFKTVSLMLALETGKISLYEKFNTKNWRGFTEENKLDSFLSVSKIIEQSSNMGTGNMVDKAFGRDIKKFVGAIKDLKITDEIGGINEVKPYINMQWANESMLRISHGYQIRLAPIHVLSFYNAIANNGTMVKPRLVRGIIRRSTGKVEMIAPEIIKKSICSKNTLDTVKMTLSRVVGQGSARQIAGSPYGIAGKTGTAMMHIGSEGYKEKESSYEMSSFCGYFPEKKPRYSCIVVLYSKLLSKTERESFSASSTAVPVFRKVSDKIYALYLEKIFIPSGTSANIPAVKNTRGENLSIISKKLYLHIPVDSNGWLRVDTVNRKWQTSEIPVNGKTVPDVTGMGLRDAVFLLENKGLRVSSSGIGTVIKQSPEKGAAFNSGQRIYLTLSNDQVSEF